MKQWYKVLDYKGHQDAGRSKEIVFYIYAENMVKAIDIYNKTPSLKKIFQRSFIKYKKRKRKKRDVFFPTIIALPEDESKNLETIIGYNYLNTAKEKGYYFIKG